MRSSDFVSRPLAITKSRYHSLATRMLQILVASSMLISPLVNVTPAQASSPSSEPSSSANPPHLASASLNSELSSILAQTVFERPEPLVDARPAPSEAQSNNLIGPSTPLSYDFFPSRSQPILPADQTIRPYFYTSDSLIGYGMRYNSGRVEGGWAYPNASYSQGDTVHIIGRMKCFRYGYPNACAYTSNGFSVGGGDSNGPIGTAGFRFSIDFKSLLARPLEPQQHFLRMLRVS